MTNLLVYALVLSGSAWAADTRPPSLEVVQKQLFDESFKTFLTEFGKNNKQYNVKASDVTAPDYDANLKRDEWLSSFSEAVSRANKLSPNDAAALKAKAQEQFTSYFHNQGYSRMAYLQPLPSDFSTGYSATAKKVTPIDLPQNYPADSTIDIHSYIDGRFPASLQSFFKNTKATFYMDDSTCRDAAAYQAAHGFTTAIRYMGTRDNPESTFMIFHNPSKNQYRFLACQIFGADDKTKAIDMFGPLFYPRKAYFVQHTTKAPLFAWNDEGRALRIDPVVDRVIIGFQNTIWWSIHEGDWKRDSLNTDGTDVSLFYNAKTKEQIISIASVYGDEMLDTLAVLYARGARRFILAGTSGGLDSKVNLGDVLLPNRFQETDGHWVPYTNAAEKYKLSVDSPVKIVHGSAQGWVPDLEVETRPNMTKMQSEGVQAIDIESKYFAEFANSHPDIESSVIISVSDLVLGTLTYDQESVTRKIPMTVVDSLVPLILSATTAKQKSADNRSVPDLKNGPSPASVLPPKSMKPAKRAPSRATRPK